MPDEELVFDWHEEIVSNETTQKRLINNKFERFRFILELSFRTFFTVQEALHVVNETHASTVEILIVF